MKCTECGANLPYDTYGNIKCEYCNTPNYIPVPKRVEEAFDKEPEPITKGSFHNIYPKRFCRFNMGEKEVTIHTTWTGAIIVKVDGKKIKSFRTIFGGKKEWIFMIGENNIKLIMVFAKLFGGVRAVKYEVYVTKKNANYKEMKTSVSDDDLISKLERLGKLKEQGILTEEEFESKKKELLTRM